MPFDIGGFVYDTTLIRNYTKGGIVTDGLVLHLDAAYGNSYPKGGTTWYDLSGNSNNGTLTNGPTYSSGNGGYISFDGSDDYITAQNVQPGTNNFTILVWVYKLNNTSNDYIWDFGSNGGTLSSGTDVSGYGFRYYNSTLGITSNMYTQGTAPNTNQWYNVAITRNSGVSSMYVDGVFVTSQSGDTHNISSSTLYIGRYGGGTGYEHYGYMSHFLIYNRALSATEITQNYNATKNRFIFQKVNYVLSSGLSITGNGTDEVTIRRESGTTGWNAHAYSTEGFTAPCTIEFYKYAETSDNGVSYAMIGWNADPTANTSYDTLDWAAYPYRTDNYSVYHNGGQVHFGTAWDSNKKFYIVYDTDGWIRHYNGSTLLYSVNKGTGGTVYVDTSFYINHPYYNAFHSVKVAKASWNGTTYI